MTSRRRLLLCHAGRREHMIIDQLIQYRQEASRSAVHESGGALVSESNSRRTPDTTADGPISTAPNPVIAMPLAMIIATMSACCSACQAIPVAMAATPL